jgi:DNA-binding response OmpR family regulator
MLTETVLIEQNRQLRERVSELEESLRQVREALATGDPLPAGLPYLTRQEERLLRAFLRTANIISRDQLHSAMYLHNETDTEPHIVDVHLTRLRRKLKPFGYRFVSSWGRGWRLECPAQRVAA